MNREELDCYLRQSTPREKEVLQGIPLEELHRQDTCRFAKAGQGTYLFEESVFILNYVIYGQGAAVRR